MPQTGLRRQRAPASCQLPRGKGEEEKASSRTHLPSNKWRQMSRTPRFRSAHSSGIELGAPSPAVSALPHRKTLGIRRRSALPATSNDTKHGVCRCPPPLPSALLCRCRGSCYQTRSNGKLRIANSDNKSPPTPSSAAPYNLFKQGEQAKIAGHRQLKGNMAPDPLAEGARHNSRHSLQRPDPPCPHNPSKTVAYPMSTSRCGAPMFAVRPGPVTNKEPYWMVPPQFNNDF
ncbi:hypothetical protein B0H34DRAFT_671731 [Crassisporium funariophilum]|nr:hypothetical protein B0H34DRAFT_671731 [Crassisporium funariophilum]